MEQFRLKTMKISDSLSTDKGRMVRHSGRTRQGKGSEKIPTLQFCHIKIRGYDSKILVSFLLYNSEGYYAKNEMFYIPNHSMLYFPSWNLYHPTLK